MIPILLPELGTTRIKFAVWLVELNEPVREGERLAEVLIPGASVDIVSPATGWLRVRHVYPSQPLDPSQCLGELQLQQGS